MSDVSEWNPEPGRLYTRTIERKGGIRDATLAVYINQREHYPIADLYLSTHHGNRAEPRSSICKYFEVGGHLLMNGRITRTITTRGDVALLEQHWSRYAIPFGEWAKRMVELEPDFCGFELHAEDRAMILAAKDG